MVFIGLNPSTADESRDDPTIRRCLGFARRWGHGGLEMLNLYGWRSTDPAPLWRDVPDPVGPGNDEALLIVARGAARVVCAWGAFPRADARAASVLGALRAAGVTPLVLGWSAAGRPRHPLYVRADAEPARWSEALADGHTQGDDSGSTPR